MPPPPPSPPPLTTPNLPTWTPPPNRPSLNPPPLPMPPPLPPLGAFGPLLLGGESRTEARRRPPRAVLASLPRRPPAMLRTQTL